MADSGTYTPETLLRRYKIAEQLMSQGAPIKSWAEGLNEVAKGALGSFQLNRLEGKEASARHDAVAQALAAFGGTPGAAAPAAPSGPAPDLAQSAGAPPVQVIANGDNAPSPLDPPSGQDRDIGIRTMYGEDPGASALGVANVLRKRAINGIGGSNLTDVAKAPGQFEPWSNPAARSRMASLSPDSPDYQRLGATLDSAYAPNAVDPTGGATNFFAPKAQAALGRDVPAWATGPSTTIGPHAFYGGVASALNGQPSPQGGTPAPAPAVAPAAPAAPNNRAAAIAALLNPFTPPALSSALAGQINPSYGFQTLPDGTVLRTNPKDGSVAPIYQSNKPQFVPNATHDQYGNPQGAFVDPTNQSIKVIGQNGQAVTPGAPGAPGTPAADGANLDLHGEDYLKTIDPSKVETLKGIAEGRIPYPSGFVMKTPYGQWLQSALGQYKPGLTAQDYNTIAQTRKNYTSGPAFNEIKAINTAIGHATKLYGVSDKLGGSDTLPGYVNPVVQGVKNNFPSVDPGFQTAKKEYDALSETLATEVSKAINGGKPHVADKEHWRQIFANADGPTQRKAAVKAAMEILEGRTTPLAQGYEQGMKSAGEPLTIVSPENQKVFERLLAGKSPNGDASDAAPSGIDPAALAEAKRRGLVP